MGVKKFTLAADIITHAPKKIQPVLAELVGAKAMSKIDRGFRVKAALKGETARDLNRALLSALRRVSKKTTLRAEWTNNGVTERFFDYVPKGVRKG